MNSDLRDRLAHLAEEAPTSVGTGRDLWQKGVRRRWRHRAAAAVVSVAAVVAVMGGTTLLGGLAPTRTVPADVPASELHLPRTVHAPSPWADGTDELGPPGPLAALAIAPRNVVDGLTEVRQTLDVFGVSAVDGSSVFLDLPGARTIEGTQLGIGSIALSPDGRRVGLVHYEGDPGAGDTGWLSPARVTGWDVYDTVTGEITRMRVPGMDEIHGMDAFEIQFSGDSRYLLTNYSPSGSEGSRDDTLVAWDVTTGEPIVAEGTGYYWLPVPGSAPEGVVWSRDRRIFRFDPTTGAKSMITLSREVVTASFGPDGRALAYVGHRPSEPGKPAPWYLFGGETWQVADRVRLDVEPGTILGWRSEDEVVVSNGRTVQVFDLRTGEADTVTLGLSRGLMLPPQYAADLWRNPLVEGLEPPSVPDPRWWMRPMLWVAGAVAALAALVGIRWSRRARVR